MDELAKLIAHTEVVELVIGLFLTLILKDLVTTFANGVLFYLNKDFNSGDKIMLNGTEAVIISIGWRQSIFEVNVDGVKTWEYVYNDKIKNLRLGKIKE